MTTTFAGPIEFNLSDSFILLLFFIPLFGAALLSLYLGVRGVRHAYLAIINPGNGSAKYNVLASTSFIFIVVGASLLLHFALSGGPNKGEVVRLSGNDYFELQLGLGLFLSGTFFSFFCTKK